MNMQNVAKFFNTAGPVQFDFHYKIDPLKRIDSEEVFDLIDQAKYFVMHAPRQSGKTSALFALRDYLNSTGNYYALYINIEAGQSKRGNEIEVIKGFLSAVNREMAALFKFDWVHELYLSILQANNFSEAITYMLSTISLKLDKPFILFIDEIDALVGDSLISVLRQIRAGYGSRPQSFPQSIILCGVRDVRDYRIHTANQEIITGGSAFNIKAESLRVGNFSKAEIKELYLQHTAETTQKFEDECFDLAWRYTEGQPWLVNALAYEVTYKMKENRDRSIVITADMFVQAKENLVKRRETHLDALLERLKEDRVARVIAPIMAGEDIDMSVTLNDDIEYTYDLGLIAIDKPIRIANEIYQEVIPRELTWASQNVLHQQSAWYINEDNTINMQKLMIEFQEFYRENSDWFTKDKNFKYIESGSQLLIQAFLQRVVNGGGYIHREYGLGSGRTDLLIIKPLTKGYGGLKQRIVMELKVRRKENLDTLTEIGLKQTAKYIDSVGDLSEGHLVIFDSSKEMSWNDKIYQRTEIIDGKTIYIWGL